jgi:hypothetical protein
MGGTEVGPWLRRWASECSTSIVEVGSWLGAGTAQLALGARESGASIHVYDNWRATEEEVEKARRAGVELRRGQDTLPLVRANLELFDVDITFHQGDIRRSAWPGGPIGLYVDDAAKQPRTFRHVVSTFAPHWQDGCVVVLMDYWYFRKGGFRYRSQQVWAWWNRARLERLEDRIAGTSAAAFRVLRR